MSKKQITTDKYYQYTVEVALRDGDYLAWFKLYPCTQGKNDFFSIVNYAMSELSDLGDELGGDGECGWELRRDNPPCDSRILIYNWQDNEEYENVEDFLLKNHVVAVRILNKTEVERWS